MVAQGLTADIFLQLTTTLAHMSAISNNNNMSTVNNNNISIGDNNIDVIKNDTDVSNNGTFLNLERGCSPSSKLIIIGLSLTDHHQYLS